jgi:hypothetical protein
VHAQLPVLHWRVAALQHSPARQSLFDLQQGSHAPLAPQQVPGPQSLSPQHWAAVQLSSQHLRPAPHCASLVQAQFSAPHCWVNASQHWPARQSALDLQQGAHAPPWQQVPGPQSLSPQHWAEAQAPPQHFCPAPHCASLVQAQLPVVHCWVEGLQHSPARQSARDLQQGAHAPPWQQVPGPQSPSSQQVATTHCETEPPVPVPLPVLVPLELALAPEPVLAPPEPVWAPPHPEPEPPPPVFAVPVWSSPPPEQPHPAPRTRPKPSASVRLGAVAEEDPKADGSAQLLS